MAQGLTPQTMAADAFGRFIEAERRRFGELIKTNNLTLD